jgi:hypothetical protein
MRTRRSSHVHALSTEDFLGANFLELRQGEVRGILLVSSRGYSGVGIDHERRQNPRPCSCSGDYAHPVTSRGGVSVLLV